MDDLKNPKKNQDEGQKGGEATSEEEQQDITDTSDLYGDMDEDTD